MSDLWSRFRGLPSWAQLIAWMAAWPLLVPVWIVGRWHARWATVAAAVFALVFTPTWGVALFGGQDTPDTGARQAGVAADAGDDASPSETRTTAPPNPSPSPTRTSPTTQSTSPTPTGPHATFTVTSITDGDTLRATGTDGAIIIRLAQVDAPETPDECFSADAEDGLLSLAPTGTAITLRRPGPPFEDRFGRKVGEVITADGTSVNVELVRRGFAAFGAGFADEDPELAERLRVAEGEAKAANAGLWGACGGPHVTRVAAAPPPPPPPPASPAQETAQPPPDDERGQANPWGTSSCDPAYAPCVPPRSETGDLDCPDIERYYPGGVSVDHTYGDPHGLDRDQDGRGCE